MGDIRRTCITNIVEDIIETAATIGASLRCDSTEGQFFWVFNT
jgi:hypothetical protein